MQRVMHFTEKTGGCSTVNVHVVSVATSRSRHHLETH